MSDSLLNAQQIYILQEQHRSSGIIGQPPITRRSKLIVFAAAGVGADDMMLCTESVTIVCKRNKLIKLN